MDPIVFGAISAANAIGIDLDRFRLLTALVALFLLGIGHHRHAIDGGRFSAFGWPLIGLYFYLDVPHYLEIGDIVLVVMSAATLPAAIALATWEWRAQSHGGTEPAMVWLRGAVFWSVTPYLLVSNVPYLNASLVWFTALVTVAFLSFAGYSDISMASMAVESTNGGITAWSEWQGDRWLLTESLGEGGFHVPLLQGGEPIHIAIVLACSALQSMIVFVGAIVALKTAPLQRRLRCLFIALPTILVLNAFRNAGIVWLHIAYPNWTVLGLTVFDFAHSYAAKFGALFAMFLMAIALFDLLPELHHHIMRLIPKALGGDGYGERNQ